MKKYEIVRDRYENFRARCLNTKSKKEKGCTEPLYGIKSKCVLHVVPITKQINTLKIDSKCKIK